MQIMQNCDIHSGEIYFLNPNPMIGNPCANGFWTDRPAVVISNDDYNEGPDVLAVFLTRKADDEAKEYYKRISPRQVTVECGGRPATALCSLVYIVSKDDLEDRIEIITQNELLRIIDEVKKDELDPYYLDNLYQPGAPENDLQIE